jgi:antitoxin (DNA-binding transcriptional repressor) of toxin-antitoxin stability system
MLQLLQQEPVMGVMTSRELNANVAQALDRAEAGEIISITRNGKATAELHPPRRVRDQDWHEAYERMKRRMKEGLFTEPVGTITYEDKHGADAL